LIGKLATVIEMSSMQALRAGMFNACALETELVKTPLVIRISSRLARSSLFLKNHAIHISPLSFSAILNLLFRGEFYP
jgi:hypothetical protein